jgi:hypothetical protein
MIQYSNHHRTVCHGCGMFNKGPPLQATRPVGSASRSVIKQNDTILKPPSDRLSWTPDVQSGIPPLPVTRPVGSASRSVIRMIQYSNHHRTVCHGCGMFNQGPPLPATRPVGSVSRSVIKQNDTILKPPSDRLSWMRDVQSGIPPLPVTRPVGSSSRSVTKQNDTILKPPSDRLSWMRDVQSGPTPLSDTASCISFTLCNQTE